MCSMMDMNKTPTAASAAFEKLKPPTNTADEELLGLPETSKLLYTAANAAAVGYVMMITILYTITPSEDLVYLSPSERQTAVVAFYSLIVASFLTVMSLSPVARSRRKTTKGERVNAILYGAIVIQVIAITTNGILAFFPVMVRIDVVTHSPVYLIRWCEWVPLSGLMTFLSEGVDLRRNKSSVRFAIFSSVMQSFSCITGGILCAYATDAVSWSIWMTISWGAYFIMFYRVYLRKTAFANLSKQGPYYGLKEKHDRLRLSYVLITTCCCVWMTLCVLYVINAFIHRCLAPTHFIRRGMGTATAMAFDTLFDVIAKALYMKWIVDVHFAVFDAEGRAMRQLSELRNLMSVLWNQSSDVIIISVRHGNKIVAIVSPSFRRMISSDKSTNVGSATEEALLMEIQRTGNAEDNPQRGDDEVMEVTKACYIDSADIVPYDKWSGHSQQLRGEQVDASDFVAMNGKLLIAAAWQRAVSVSEDSVLLTYPFVDETGGERKSEIRVSQRGEDAIVCVVRDVTERYRRFEAERQAHAEVLRRQKDAQSQTRFVRHEVKNGLLAGIELCDTLKNQIESALQSLQSTTGGSEVDLDMSSRSFHLLDSIEESPAAVIQSCNAAQTARKGVESLDLLLHEVLETVLAEAMARDVINEIYKPRSECLDVLAVLTSSVSTKSGKTERFPIQIKGKAVPFLHLDPQLLRYIHRNAVSNAAKYGKTGGMVNTTLQYDSAAQVLSMDVINEPGDDHERIMSLGQEKANQVVFSQGGSLHDDGSIISSGDGAWIISKCAKTMGGTCSISFEEERTVFTFQVKVEPIVSENIVCAKDFTVPANTFGIAIDDSKIQRKLMHRMLLNVGVQKNMLQVIGETPVEVMGLKDLIVKKLNQHPDHRILVLVDENLDYGGTNTEQAKMSMISGSLVMEQILKSLTKEQKERILALVRSANDSAEDVAMYTSRTHGFIPKAPMHKERVREILAPQWTERFMDQKVQNR